MNHGVARQRKQALDRRVAQEEADAAAEKALTEGYTCQEKYDLGACNACTEGELPEPAKAGAQRMIDQVIEDNSKTDFNTKKTMFPPGTIETFTGDVYNFQEPDPNTIHLADIAHALSNHCRYAGHTSRFYSVGEHSVIVSNILKAQGYSETKQLLGLFHDAHEAYVMDAPRPLKPLLGPAFKEVASKADRVIAVWLSHAAELAILPSDFELALIKQADNMALVYERKQLMTAGPDQWEPGYEDVEDLPCELNSPVLGLHPSIVEQAFLNRAKELGVTE